MRLMLPVGVEGSWPAALDELLARVLHCCYGDSWSTRIGGLSAVTLLANRFVLSLMKCCCVCNQYVLRHVIRKSRALCLPTVDVCLNTPEGSDKASHAQHLAC